MRRLFRSRRRVVVAVVAALVVAGVGASSASAAGPVGASSTDLAKCAPAYSSSEILCAAMIALARASQSADFTPRDLAVAAPSSVIAAVGSESPTRRVQEVTHWRPNTQAWVDAKTRVAGTSGLTTADIASTSRWAPRIAKFIGVGGALGLGAEIGFTLADNVLYPALGFNSSVVEDSFCLRRGNFATDFLAGLRGANCAEWRLPQDYQLLVGEEMIQSAVLEFGGGSLRFVKTTDSGRHCWLASPNPWDLGTGYYFSFTGSGSNGRAVANNTWDLNCGPSGLFAVQTGDLWMPQVRSLATDAVVADVEVEASADAAEWLTRVRCMDGSSRLAVSESFQQQKLGGVAVPASVTLSGCQPVGVDVAMQKAGTGTSGAGGGWSSVPGGDRTQVASGEVPEPVRDWMQTYPQCAEGACLLELVKDVGGHELSCFDVPDECMEWKSETDNGTATYRCYYAQQLLDLSECNVYARTFDRDKVQQGTGYADPATGETAKTGTGTTATTNPGAARIAMESPVADPAGERQCWPSGWGVLNPFEWVYLPVKCALEWAFVPRAEKVTQVQTQLQLKVTNSQVGRAAQVAATWAAVADATNPSGCAGPTISLNLMGIEYSGNPLSACAEPAATLAFWSRIIIGITVVLAALFAVTRYIGRVFGFEGFGRSAGGDS